MFSPDTMVLRVVTSALLLPFDHSSPFSRDFYAYRSCIMAFSGNSKFERRRTEGSSRDTRLFHRLPLQQVAKSQVLSCLSTCSTRNPVVSFADTLSASGFHMCIPKADIEKTKRARYIAITLGG